MIVTCEACNSSFPEDEWLDAWSYCEDCGEHTAHKCPSCGEVYDDIYDWDDLERSDAGRTQQLC